MTSLKPFYFSIIIILLICSCSSNDDSSSGNGGMLPGTSNNYFPLSSNNYWNYDVDNTDSVTNLSTTSHDSLFVINENMPIYILGVNDNMIATGTMNGILTSGELTFGQTSLSLDGSLELPTQIADLFDFDIMLDNLTLYDSSISSNTVLSTISNSIQEDINGVPIIINYSVSTKSLGNIASMDVDGISYDDITSAEFTLNMSMSATVSIQGIPFTINILDPQDILVITNNFANNIGLIKSESLTSYEISPAAVLALETSGIDLGIPTSGSGFNIAELSDYMIQ